MGRTKRSWRFGRLSHFNYPITGGAYAWSGGILLVVPLIILS